MRVIASILAAFVASGPAAAQSWNEYAYPSYSFAISFPLTPRSKSRLIKRPTTVLSKRTDS
jgi:hypothetical protein